MHMKLHVKLETNGQGAKHNATDYRKKGPHNNSLLNFSEIGRSRLPFTAQKR